MFNKIREMSAMSKIVTVVIIIILVASFGYWRGWFGGKGKVNPLNLNASRQESGAPVNSGNVSPFSGIACANWNRRPIAVME
ncbi:MAG TPA: hypothetical protein VK254_03730, partial [Candidatus Bathyarchaeia archaeon]|nr:hypothetical protein [Candidatus Bathyarchaeia archaeon]